MGIVHVGCSHALVQTAEHEKSGVVKFGVADYEPRKSTAKVCAPTRPALCPPPTEYESGLLM